MQIVFDSKSKREVLAVQLALNHLASTFPREEPKEAPAPVERPVIVQPNRRTRISEGHMSEEERKKYPNLYKLAVRTYEWMKVGKFYTNDEIRAAMKEFGHPESSSSGTMSHLVKHGYVERPMKGLFVRNLK